MQIELTIPEHLIGKNVEINIGDPVITPQGILWPSFPAFLKADLAGAVLLLVDQQEVLYPKRLIGRLATTSGLALATTMPGRPS